MSQRRGGYITLNPSRGASVWVLVESHPEREGGVGGWQASERSGRRPAKWFGSVPDDTMTINGILDIDALQGQSIETRLRRLRLMGLPGGPENEPPTVRIRGDIWDHDKTIVWVMASGGMSLGPRLWNSDGSLRRQHVTLTFERYNGLDEIEPIKVRSTRRRGQRRRRRVTARYGDTLRAIALRELGSAARWKDLRRWNKKLRKTDPDQRLRAGTHVLVR